MEKLLSRKQVIILFFICVMASKIQRFPGLIASVAGRDGWLCILVLFAIDILLCLVALRINKLSQQTTLYETLSRGSNKVIAKIIIIFFIIFFLFKGTSNYKAIHEFFASVLFDRLSWEFYSLAFISLIIFMVRKGIQTIGRTAEIFYRFILLGFIVALVFGIITTDFSQVLPILNTGESFLFKIVKNYAFWFSDFTLILMFSGLMRHEKKGLTKPLMLTYVTLCVVFCLLYIVFYGLYQNLSAFQTHGLSAITQFSLLSLDIGRIDWFFLMLAQTSTVIATICYLFFAVNCTQQLFNRKNNSIVITCVIIALVWILDLFLFNNIEIFMRTIYSVLSYYVIGLETIVLGVIWIIAKKSSKKPLLNK
ncbi:MAG: GerAB/ArcD/ProY family transporter [Clostridia bacterium]